MHKFNSFKFIIVFLIVCMTISSSESNKYNESHRRMVGGYSPVETNDPQVILASELVLRNLTQGKGPIEKYSFLLTSQSEDSQHFQVKVVEASQQVVAGMNYRLKLGIFMNSDCVGGLSATVFRDLQGHWSVSSYGNELTCDDVEQLLNNNNEDANSFKDDA